MKIWKTLLLGLAALGLVATGFAQPANYLFIYYDDGSGSNPALGCPCVAGTPYADGPELCLFWDADANGYSADDTQPGIGQDYGQVNENCFSLNGEELGLGPGYFGLTSYLVFLTPVQPDSGHNPYYYWRINTSQGANTCCWYSDTFRVNEGDLMEVYMTGDDWHCAAQACSSDIDLPTPPTACNASDDLYCLSVRVSWAHSGQNVSSFKVYKDALPSPVATVPATARQVDVPECDVSPHTYRVRASNPAGESTPSNADQGSTYLKRFYPGPEGDLTGDSLAGLTDSIRMQRPSPTCNSGSKLYLIYNMDETPTQWGLLASCSLCTMIRFTLPSIDTLNHCKLALRCSSFDVNCITWDTTESIFHLGYPNAAELRNLVLPDRFDLAQNFPNPFNPETQIVFNVPNAADVKIRVYNVTGQLVRTLTDQRYSVGMHQVTWDGRTDSGQLVSAGVYLYRLEAPGISLTKKMLLMK
ncbi:T9SS type A sorting domain-containing protein [bacterium]|nr:T9SS type A sorting domain-containing protein [bacterium]MBU1983322.1 T9SS type A sorting domain-containing protein [bacterium]